MNERFRELAEQAVEQVCSKRTLSDGQIERAWHPDQFNQVFAELIVRECITTMTNLESDIKQKFPWKKEEVVSTSGHIQKLKEHFGVES